METTYQKGYWEMEYIIYDRPIRMKKTDVLREYTDGGAFLYQCEEGSEDLDILAHIKYVEGWPRLRYHRAIKLEPAFAKISPWNLEVFHPIQKADINVEYLYAFMARTEKHAYVVLRVEDNVAAEAALTEAGFKMISEADICKL